MIAKYGDLDQMALGEKYPPDLLAKACVGIDFAKLKTVPGTPGRSDGVLHHSNFDNSGPPV